MRRGSISTFADDGRRHCESAQPAAGMVTPEYRSNNNAGASNGSNRQEFAMNDIGYERTGGCFVSYRKIAFAFVFVLAVIIAAAFIGVHLSMPQDNGIKDPLAILNKDEDVPDRYFLAPSITPRRYRVELAPSVEPDKRVRIKGRVSIDFVQNGTESPSQVVLSVKHLNITSYRLVVVGGGAGDKEANNVTKTAGKVPAGGGNRRRKRQVEEPKNETAPAAPSQNNTVPTVPEITTSPSVMANETVTTTSDSSANVTVPTSTRMAEEVSFLTELTCSGNKTDEAAGDYVIFLKNALKDGQYILDIEYEALVDDRVLVVKNVSKGAEEKLLLVSRLRPVSAPRLFPTLDDARLKARFALTVLHPRDSKALSNMPLMNSSDSNTENLTADTFMETPLMSAHNLAFVAGKIENLGEIVVDETKGQSIAYWGDVERKSQEFYLRDKLGPVMHAYSELFGGVDRPTDKLVLAALPVDFDGLSAPGLIIFKESLFYAVAGSTPLLRAKALLNLLGLVGQQWLGGLVDSRNWTDAWYAEGSVIYLQHTLLDKIDQSLVGSSEFLVDVQMEALENAGYKISKALDSKVDRNRIEAFDLVENYKTGACLISMLHDALGEAAFRTGYADFLRRWGYATADSATFLRALAGNATADGNATRLDEAFRSWTRQPGYPVINVTWIRENGTVTLRQERFDFDASPPDDEEEAPTKSSELWWVPITWVSSNGSWTAPSKVWLKGEEEMTLENVVQGGNGSWIVINVNRTGFYRVNYDDATWKSLSAALKERHGDFPPLQRAALIDDALSLARQGGVKYETALELLAYLGPSERVYAPWRAFARHAAQLDFALYETAAYSSFQEFMRKVVSTLFDEMEPKIDEGSPLVMLAIQLACLFEHQKCTSWARTKWEEIFRNKAENTLVKHVRETVYCVGAQRGGREELTYLLQKSEETSDRDERDRLLSALGCFQTPWILQKVLNEILETSKYEENDVKVILQSYAKNPAAAQAARRFVQDNWKEIVKRYSKSYWTMKAFVEASTSLLFTEHDLNEFNGFRDKHIDSLKAMGHWVALNEVKASSWIFRLKQSSSSIQQWFRNHTS